MCRLPLPDRLRPRAATRPLSGGLDLPNPDVVSSAMQDDGLSEQPLKGFPDVVLPRRPGREAPAPSLILRQHTSEPEPISRAALRVDACGPVWIALPAEVALARRSTVAEVRVGRAVAQVSPEDPGRSLQIGGVSQTRAIAARVAPQCAPQLFGRRSWQSIRSLAAPTVGVVRSARSSARNRASRAGSCRGRPTSSAEMTYAPSSRPRDSADPR